VDQARAGRAEGARGRSPLVDLAPLVPLEEVFRRFWPVLRPYRWRLALTLLLVAVGPLIDVMIIRLYGRLIDDALVPGDFAALLPIAAAYLAWTLLAGAVGFGRDYLSAWVGETFLLDLRTRLFRHLHRLPLHVLERRRLGDLMARLNDDVDEVEGLMVSGVEQAVGQTLRLLFFVGALFWIDWRLALVALLVAAPFWFAARRFAGRIKAVSREQRSRDGAINAVAEESLGNAPLVQAFHRQAAETARFEREAQGNFQAQLALARLQAFFSPLVNLLELAGVLVVVGFGAWRLSQGAITLGDLLVFLAFLSQLYEPVRGLSRLATDLGAGAAGAERVLEVLDEEPPVPEQPGAVDLPRPTGRGGLAVEFDGVGFRYPGAARDALADVSLRVGPGETLALVGPSGAGKSSLIRLLLRFADPTNGTVRLAGHDLRDLTVASLRDNIAVLLQEPFLFDGTIAENIAFGRPGATEAEICDAARAADAHDFILELPDGYQTRVGQRGRALSGGQRQRVAIARAMLRDAPLLILDEPTTGLDADSSERILEPLRRLMRDRTTIIVSHTLLTVREATTIAVVDRGRVVEQGSHDALLARRGAYARLFRLHRSTPTAGTRPEPTFEPDRANPAFAGEDCPLRSLAAAS